MVPTPIVTQCALFGLSRLASQACKPLEFLEIVRTRITMKRFVRIVLALFLAGGMVFAHRCYGQGIEKRADIFKIFPYKKHQGDGVDAAYGPYLVVSISDGDTASRFLIKRDEEGREMVIANDQDIEKYIEKLTASKVAYHLIDQLVKKEIKEDGGARKVQADVDEEEKKGGKEFYNYMSPLTIRIYGENGVHIPMPHYSKEILEDLRNR